MILIRKEMIRIKSLADSKNKARVASFEQLL
jgi:hypothetical protein